ncbi:unnamed protein product [Larinioides sclopetarius]|uniref:C2H2-type domain-containing protein n=1 Tax=Larinioides sclopetarius TaxID=280406 RepID=A0AAV2A986_9ARAC
MPNTLNRVVGNINHIHNDWVTETGSSSLDAMAMLCLFCEKEIAEDQNVWDHMAIEDLPLRQMDQVLLKELEQQGAHVFSFKDMVRSYKLSAIHQFRVLNYIREKSTNLYCYLCVTQFPTQAKLRKHLKQSKHGMMCPPMEIWNKWRYMKTAADDRLMDLFFNEQSD